MATSATKANIVNPITTKAEALRHEQATIALAKSNMGLARQRVKQCTEQAGP
jgi:hypothetical protein